MSEIIIDGVDVSGCEFYEEMRELPDNLNGGYYIQHCYCGLQGDNYCICNKNPDCYYKQLKRLQAENEELKEATDNLLQVQYALADSCNKYSKALEEIREILKGNKDGDIDEMINKINEVLK